MHYKTIDVTVKKKDKIYIINISSVIQNQCLSTHEQRWPVNFELLTYFRDGTIYHK